MLVGFAFSMQRQQLPNWCWSASCVSVADHYGGTSWTQCALATVEYQDCGKIKPGHDCCRDDTPCNLTHPTASGLLRVGCYKDIDGPLSPEHLIDELQQACPVCIRIDWGKRDGHAVVIFGYDDEEEIVFFGDPGIRGAPTLSSRPYDRLKSTSGKRWTKSLLTGVPGRSLDQGQHEPGEVPLAERIPPFLIDYRNNATIAAMGEHPSIDVYWLSVSDLAEGGSFEPHHVGRETRLSESESSLEDDDGNVTLNVGEGVSLRFRDLVRISRQNNKWKLSFIEVPSLSIVAVWNEEEDWIIPIVLTPRELVAGERYPTKSFAERLHEQAIQYLEVREQELQLERNLGFRPPGFDRGI